MSEKVCEPSFTYRLFEFSINRLFQFFGYPQSEVENTASTSVSIVKQSGFQSHPVVHASSTDICIHYTNCMPEVPVSTCVCFHCSDVPHRTIFYRLTGFVQKAKSFLPDIDGSIAFIFKSSIRIASYWSASLVLSL